MSGGGPRYEAFELGKAQLPEPEALLLEERKERIDRAVRLRTRTLTVVLDRLEDAFNMAAVLRTCEAFGIQEVHVVDNPEVPFSPNGAVTQGCDKWLDVRRYREFAACKAELLGRGFELWVSAAGERAVSLYDVRFDRPVALVFGNERTGVSEEVLQAAHGVFWIPMRGFTQSLNISAACAATVCRAVGWRVEHGQPEGDLTPEQAGDLTRRFQVLSVKQRRRIYRGSRP